jgi:hypothetical protein
MERSRRSRRIPAPQQVGIGIGMAIEGDFHEVSDIGRGTACIGPAAAEYTGTYVRPATAHGNPDLLVLNNFSAGSRRRAGDRTAGRSWSSPTTISTGASRSVSGERRCRRGRKGPITGCSWRFNYDGKPTRGRFHDRSRRERAESWLEEGKEGRRQSSATRTRRLDFEVPWRGADRQESRGIAAGCAHCPYIPPSAGGCARRQ